MLDHISLRTSSVPGAYDIIIVVVQSPSQVWLFVTHRLHRARLLCPSLSPEVCSDSYSLSWWCYVTISSSATLFFCFQSFPASASFPMSQLFASGGQSVGASTLVSVPPVNIQDWFPLGLTGLISIQSKGLSRVFSSTTVWKHQFLGTQPSLWSNPHMSMTAGQTIALTIWTFVDKVMTLVFNMLAVLNACLSLS